MRVLTALCVLAMAGTIGNAAGALGGEAGSDVAWGGLDASASQALVAQQTQKTGTAQATNAIAIANANAPELTRASHLFELATAKKCAWIPTSAGGAER